MLKTAFALTGGRLFSMVSTVVLLIIQSRFIGPDTTGKAAYFAIPLGYLWILTLGIPSALARELPYYLATGERDKALKLTQTAQSFTVVISLLCSTAFAILSIKALILGNYFFAIGWAVQVPNSFFQIYTIYLTTTYRTTDEFVTLAKSSTIQAITNIVLFPVLFINPYLLLFSKQISSTITANVYLYVKRPFKLKFGFDFKCFTKLFKFGLPIVIIGYIEGSLWTSAQSSMIVSMGNTTWLGLFTFINNILMALLIIPNAFADILRPKFAATYGQTDGNIRKTLMVAAKPLAFTLLFSVIVIIFSRLFLGDIVRWLLPKYIDAVPALNYSLLLVPVTAVSCIKYIFVVTKNTLHNAISTITGFAVGIGLLYLGLTNGMDFKYIFLPYVIGRFVNVIISAFLLLITKRNNHKKVSKAGDVKQKADSQII
jgi:O-antigen/teichoic acid export membrane protein